MPLLQTSLYIGLVAGKHHEQFNGVWFYEPSTLEWRQIAKNESMLQRCYDWVSAGSMVYTQCCHSIRTSDLCLQFTWEEVVSADEVLDCWTHFILHYPNASHITSQMHMDFAYTNLLEGKQQNFKSQLITIGFGNSQPLQFWLDLKDYAIILRRGGGKQGKVHAGSPISETVSQGPCQLQRPCRHGPTLCWHYTSRKHKTSLCV